MSGNNNGVMKPNMRFFGSNHHQYVRTRWGEMHTSVKRFSKRCWTQKSTIKFWSISSTNVEASDWQQLQCQHYSRSKHAASAVEEDQSWIGLIRSEKTEQSWSYQILAFKQIAFLPCILHFHILLHIYLLLIHSSRLLHSTAPAKVSKLHEASCTNCLAYWQ